MKTIIVTITCNCGYKKEHEIDTNEHGYFSIPIAYCPDCFSVLDQYVLPSKNEGVFTKINGDQS